VFIQHLNHYFEEEEEEEEVSLGVISYEARNDPESLQMERTEKDHTFI
jgi:hypothetical protein